jgi:hypothetical protein
MMGTPLIPWKDIAAAKVVHFFRERLHRNPTDRRSQADLAIIPDPSVRCVHE